MGELQEEDPSINNRYTTKKTVLSKTTVFKFPAMEGRPYNPFSMTPNLNCDQTKVTRRDTRVNQIGRPLAWDFSDMELT